MVKLNLTVETLQKLQRLMSSRSYDFLGFTLNLETGILTDKLRCSTLEDLNVCNSKILATLLSHYSLANPTLLSGRLVKFRDIPGGYAYEDTFIRRAIQPVAEVFGEKSEQLTKVAALLDGAELNLGDTSVRIFALKDIPLIYILWKADEFPASASILFDQTASNYLPTEDLAVLGEITTIRLIEAEKIRKIFK
jgi:hypothetical protein